MNKKECISCYSSNLKVKCYKSDILIDSNEYKETYFNICLDCGLHFRDINYDSKEIMKHFELVQYNQNQYNSYYRKIRQNYFVFLKNNIIKIKKDDKKKFLLDVGPSYGHFIETFQKNINYKIDGVEINSDLRNKLKSKFNGDFYSNFEQVKNKSYDVVTMIDSFYYFENPRLLLSKIYLLLKSDGIVVIRITNRQWIIRILILFNLSVPEALIGDQKTIFSIKSFKKLVLSEKFKIKKIINHEKGKNHDGILRLLIYKISELLSYLNININPGLIFILEKK